MEVVGTLKSKMAASTASTVNSRLADAPLLRTLAITVKIQIPIYRGFTEYDSRYYGLTLLRTQNEVPKVSAITRVDCSGENSKITGSHELDPKLKQISRAATRRSIHIKTHVTITTI